MVIRREEGWLWLFWAGMGRVEKWFYLGFRMLLPRPFVRGVSQDFFCYVHFVSSRDSHTTLKGDRHTAVSEK